MTIACSPQRPDFEFNLRWVLIGLGVLALVVFALAGCNQPKPARTQVTPGQSEVTLEREEIHPTESTMRVRIEPVSPTQEPIVVRVIVHPPQETQK